MSFLVSFNLTYSMSLFFIKFIPRGMIIDIKSIKYTILEILLFLRKFTEWYNGDTIPTIISTALGNTDIGKNVPDKNIIGLMYM